MPLHRQTVVGDLVVEEVPPPADKPQLSPGRTYWWDGDAWVPARSHPDAQAVLATELAKPMIEPLPDLPKAKVAPLRRLPVPKPLEEVAPAPEPEPGPALPDLEWAAAPVQRYAPPGNGEPAELEAVRWPWLEAVDKPAAAALVAAVALCWVPRFGGALALVLGVLAVLLSGLRPSRLALAALAVAVPELVVGLVLHSHAGSVAAAKAHNLEVLTRSLENAAQFETVTHTYESKFGGPIALAQHGWERDDLIRFDHVERNGYCLSATRQGVTLTVRENGVVGSVPC